MYAKRSKLLSTLAVLPGILLACGEPRIAETLPIPEGPDVVVVLIDTFRPDHLATFGYPKSTAPFLDELLARSTVFPKAYSTSSWTAPSTSSLFTSLYPTRHGVTEGFLAFSKRSDTVEDLGQESIVLNRLPDDVPTLPELFQRAGYRTLGVASNINIGEAIGFDRGFDRFSHLEGRSADHLAKTMSRWWRKAEGERPRFAYLHFNDVHIPYEPRDPWYDDTGTELERMVSAYDSEISYLDGVLRDLYEELSWDQDTLFVLVSDHGEEFMDHGQLNHGFSLYDELVTVMMAFSSDALDIPHRFEPSVNVSLIDVLPTLVDLVGISGVESREGRSLASFLLSPEPDPRVQRELTRRPLFGHRSYHRTRQGLPPEHAWSVIHGPWKLIEMPQRTRLFDRDADPDEKQNLRRKQPRVAQRLEKYLQEFQAHGFRSGESVELDLDDETYQTLESLGYVQ